MKNHQNDDNRPALVIAYMATAFCGALMGFLAGILTGWIVWA